MSRFVQSVNPRHIISMVWCREAHGIFHGDRRTRSQSQQQKQQEEEEEQRGKRDFSLMMSGTPSPEKIFIWSKRLNRESEEIVRGGGEKRKKNQTSIFFFQNYYFCLILRLLYWLSPSSPRLVGFCLPARLFGTGIHRRAARSWASGSPAVASRAGGREMRAPTLSSLRRGSVRRVHDGALLPRTQTHTRAFLS